MWTSTTNCLAQRLVKTTVNFDDPGTYHLYYGDEIGTPGTIMTFFPWPTAARGMPGNGEIGAVAYTIRPESLNYWRQRLAEHGVSVSTIDERFGAQGLTFRDPSEMVVELISMPEAAPIHFWNAGPVPEEHAIRGFHSATLWVHTAQPTADVLTHQLGYRFVNREGERWRYQAAGRGAGVFIDLLARPDIAPGRMGAGSVHHIAFRTVDDAEQAGYQLQLTREWPVCHTGARPPIFPFHLFPRTGWGLV